MAGEGQAGGCGGGRQRSPAGQLAFKGRHGVLERRCRMLHSCKRCLPQRRVTALHWGQDTLVLQAGCRLALNRSRKTFVVALAQAPP